MSVIENDILFSNVLIRKIYQTLHYHNKYECTMDQVL